MKKIILLMCAIILSLTICFPTEANAAELISKYAKWKRMAYVYSGPSVTKDTRYSKLDPRTRSHWNILLESLGSSRRLQSTSDEKKGKNTGIYCRGSKYGNTGWAGRTTYTYSKSDGFIDVELQINFTATNGYSESKRQTVFSHEYGHTLGLGDYHSGKRIMNPDVAYKYIAPTKSDKTSLDKLY